ncbi:universal stress protein [Halobacteria archaeon HArc-gm2]|nr:universal stress protein [Halobacteria archaeon HArc-gm2]
MQPSHVLVPLDGSPLAEDALEYALDVFDCPVTVLNVVSPVDASMSESGALPPEGDRLDEARDRAESILERVGDDEPSERDVDVVVETGAPAETIVDYVAATDVDQVVMGGHGGERNAVARRLLGTVATKVVGETPVTVTVVR